MLFYRGKSAGLLRSFPHSFLHISYSPISIRNIKDQHREQELSNAVYWLNSKNLPGELFREMSKKLEKCHPVFTSNRYTTRSKYYNWILKILEENEVTCMSMERVGLKNRKKNYLPI